MAVAHAELGDKTFLLLIIFTITWSTWHLGYIYKSKNKDSEIAHSKIHLSSRGMY